MNTDTEKLISRLKALADPVRMRLAALCGVTECSVSELTLVTGLSQPRISQHLKALCDADLLERFREGHFVFYRVQGGGADSAARQRLLSMLPSAEPQFARDLAKLRDIRAEGDAGADAITESDRSLHRALVELTVARPLGDLLDIGSGQGRILKLLATRAKRSVGVDVDSDQRRLARAELLLAGTPNCSLRKGDMYELPFADGEFDTVILDDVLLDANDPTAVIREAKRLLSPGGRMLLLASTDDREVTEVRSRFAAWASESGLRLAPPRQIPSKAPRWLLAVATTAAQESAVA